MPCRNGYDDENEKAHQKFINKSNAYEHQVNFLKDSVKHFEAALCALITELEKEGIAERLISQASKSGMIDLKGFWDKHKKKDENRLLKELDKFSEHEKEILKKLLNSK